MTSELPAIVYPALLWRDGYTYLAHTPLELCAHPRSLFAETLELAHAGEWRLVDAAGRCFGVADFKRIRPFGGLMGITHRLMFSIFAAPVLVNEAQLPLPEFKKELRRAIRSRYRYDGDKGPATEIIKKVQAAESCSAAIAALPKLWP